VVLLFKTTAGLLQLKQLVQKRGFQVVRSLDGCCQFILGLCGDDQGLMAGDGAPIRAVLRRPIADANVGGQGEHAVRVVNLAPPAVEIVFSLGEKAGGMSPLDHLEAQAGQDADHARAAE